MFLARLRSPIVLLLALALGLPASRPMLSAEAPSLRPPSGTRLDPLTRSGFEAYYSLDYDTAIRDFERVASANPNDPFALNHLLSAVLFHELYRIGAFDTGLYANNSFLERKQLPPDPKAGARIKELIGRVTALCDQRLAAKPDDLEALYARGVARGMQSTYMGLVEKSWIAALRNAKGARDDHERILQLDPGYVDAKTVVGVHEYIAGSLPLFVKVAAFLAGYRGNREKGLRYLYEAGNAGGESAVDAKIALGLFLRREQRYDEALGVARSLTTLYPRNFLFALEVANILNDSGHGPEAITAYQRVIENAPRFYQPHLELAYFGLGESLKGQRRYAQAVDAYANVSKQPQVEAELKLRANLYAGQMYDLMGQRRQALERYQAVLAAAPTDSRWADLARKHLKEPFHEK
ncbi:MAG TPA: tetratricopeptide repeat protein [Terriglobales bacterium]|nr:tetratricopeptide repeat protein [Terriglobales bacterium]